MVLAHHFVKELAFTINFNQLPYVSSHWLTCWVLVRITSQVCANHWQKATLIVHLPITNKRNNLLMRVYTESTILCLTVFLCQILSLVHTSSFTKELPGLSMLQLKIFWDKKIQASTATVPPKYFVHEHLLVCRIFMLTYSQEKWNYIRNKSKCKITAKGFLCTELMNSITEEGWQNAKKVLLFSE